MLKSEIKAKIYEHIATKTKENGNKLTWIPAACSRHLYGITATEYGEYLRELEKENKIIKSGYLVKAI